MSQHLKNQEGVTLIELVLVILVISILSYVAWPKSDSLLPSLELDTASRKIKSDLRHAQSLAITTGNPHGIRVLNSTTYEIYNATTNVTVKSPLTQMPLHEDLSVSFGKTTFLDNTLTFTFDAWGKPTDGVLVLIELVNGDDITSIQVAGQSGYIGD